MNLVLKSWAIKVVASSLPESVELNHLKSFICMSAKDRLYEVDYLFEAWSILDRLYGQPNYLRNNHKQEFLSISLNAKTSTYIELKIF